MKSVNHHLLTSGLEKCASGSSLDSQENSLVFQMGPGGECKD